MKIRFIHRICVPVFLAVIQLSTTASAQEKQETFTITNYFNPQYRDFQMMKISIVPPQGFGKDTDQTGFLDSKDASAIRADEIQKDIQSASTGFLKLFDSSGHNDSLGLKLIEVYHFKVNGYPSQLVNLSGNIEGEDYLMWWMFIGDTSDTYIVKGFFPVKKKKELEQQVRAALLSVFYEPDRRLIPPGGDPTTTGTSSCNCHPKN